MSVIYRYFMIVTAGIALLFGIQVPNFVDQYEKRLDAHLREVNTNLASFQQNADRNYGGNLLKMIEVYKKDPKTTYQEIGTSIESMRNRKLAFDVASEALKTNLASKVSYIMLHKESELLRETIDQYSYSIPLNRDAVMAGIGASAASLLLLELFFGVLRYFRDRLMFRRYREYAGFYY